VNQKSPRPLGLEDVTDRDVAWPRSGHDLRKLSDQPHLHAALDAKWGSAYGRVEGYRRAADVLAEHLADRASDVDFLVYPFANCWRHHIELQLKLLLPELRRLQDEDPPEDKDFGHRLSRLWDRARVLLLAAFPTDSQAEVKIVSRVISQLHQLDPDGEDFRYFTRSDGRLALDGHDFLDIANFHEALAGVSSFLDAALMQTSYHLDVKRDMESEFAPDYP
jgi:hypothetical protein